MSQPLLEVKNLVRHYERPRASFFSKKPVIQALDGVSFNVWQGETFGIVGESGAGKSTLARALLALEEPTSGSVRFKGENLFGLSADRKLAVRRHIQMIFQDPFETLDPKHKVSAVVGEPLALVDGVGAAEREDRIREALVDVGLDADDLDKSPREFSGGQRQRIAIARALITRPDLIVADEPVSAQNGSMRAQIIDLMSELQERFKLTYVIISRDPSVIRDITDRCAVLQTGVIVEQSETVRLFDRPGHAYTKAFLAAGLDAEHGDEDSETPEGAMNGTPIAIDASAAIKAADAAIAGAIASARHADAEPALEACQPETPRATWMAEDPPAPTDIPEKAVAPSAGAHTVQPVNDALMRGLETAGSDVEVDAPTDAERPGQDAPPHSPTVRAESLEPQDPAANQRQHLIGGRWQDASDDRSLKVVNPSDGETLGSLARGTAADIDSAVIAARRALDGPWGRLPAFERGRLLTRLGDLVLGNADHLAALEARDVGKPLRQARADAVALARYFEFYGGAADKIHGQTIPYHDGYTVLTLREPHGVTGHIVPWNYPMQIVGRSVGAALAMGNTTVLKPGEDASLTALEIGRLALEAGLPPGVLNVVTGHGPEAGAALAAHPGIDHISFTGSVETGRRVQMIAGGHNCPVTLELGGKSPQIVFADADLDQALPFVVNAAIQNAGQTCSAGSRVLIQDWIYDELTHRLAERFDQLDVGRAERDLDCGPVINPTQKQRIETYLERARADGIAVLAEGEIAPDTPDGGYYVKPTLLGDVPPDHRLAQEEIFGPVLCAIRFGDEEDAIRIANDSAYGLVAGIWTRDGARQMRLARAIKTGQVFINNYGAGGGVELPFGGVKSSGYGREKGFEALYGFSTLKTVAIRHG